MKTLASFFLLVALALAAPADVNVTGRWEGSFNAIGPDGSTKETGALLLLKQSGSDVAGTVGPDENERFAIQKGKVEGTKITLEVQDGHGRMMKMNLALADGRIKGDVAMSGPNGESRTAKIDVGLQK
jgi:hypothetical protein